MSDTPFNVAEGHESGGVRQITVFLENRVGQLMRLVQVFEGSSIRILAIQVQDAVDSALVRMLLDDTDGGLEVLKRAGFPSVVTELIVIEMPPGAALLTVCAALLSAEIGIDYVYPLLAQPTGRPAMAIHCDNQPMAVEVLRKRRFTVLSENDINPLR